MSPRTVAPAVLITLFALLIPAGGGVQANASGTPVPSTMSVFVSCPAGLSFSEPSGGSSCGSGDYTGTYSGVGQEIGTTQDSVFYLAGAVGGVKVAFNLTDLTSGQLLFSAVAFGSLSGETCASPLVVVPSVAYPTTTVVGAGNVTNSGDALRLSLDLFFTGTGTPVFCAGGSNSTVISMGTTVVPGSTTPVLTTTLTAGTPQQATLSGIDGFEESYTNTGGASFNAVVLGIVKDFAGSTVGVLTTSIVAAPGTGVTAFLPFNGYPPGEYSVLIFAVTSGGIPVSVPEVATASV